MIPHPRMLPFLIPTRTRAGPRYLTDSASLLTGSSEVPLPYSLLTFPLLNSCNHRLKAFLPGVVCLEFREGRWIGTSMREPWGVSSRASPSVSLLERKEGAITYRSSIGWAAD